MREPWEEWRRRLHEENADVSAEYKNRLGVWHHDFSRERATRNWRSPSSDYAGPTVYEGGFTKSGLIKRGWTRTAIKRILGDPDWHLYNGYGKDREACMYGRGRVEEAEERGKIRFRKPPPPKDPIARLCWRPRVWNGQKLPRPDGHPSAWLRELKRWDFNWIGICDPWYVDRLVFDVKDERLDIHVSHSPHVTWPCPKCDRGCKLYDHRPQRVWLKGWLRVGGWEPAGRAVQASILGRLPRCSCPKHGPRSVKPLLPFPDASSRWGRPKEGPIEWVIVPPQ